MTGAAPERWSAVRRILAVRLDGMGDVLMTGPALRAIHRSIPPGARLTLLTSASGAAAAACMPEVDRTIVAAVPWMPPAAADGAEPAGTSGAAADVALLDDLRREHFEAAVIFTVNTQSALPAALLCRLAGIPLRLAHSRENPYGLLTDWVRDHETATATRHEVARQLDLVRHVGFTTDDERLSFRVPRRAQRRVDRLVTELGLARGPGFIVIHPGATARSRRYAAGRFVAAGRRLSEADGWTIAVTGSAGEAELARSVADAIGPPAVSLAGCLTLAELGALLVRSTVLISNNSGPVHVAAALGAPVVDVYALTNPQHVPWQVPSVVLSRDVPCRGCLRSVCPLGHNACLDVPPEAIVAAARALATGIPVAPGGLLAWPAAGGGDIAAEPVPLRPGA